MEWVFTGNWSKYLGGIERKRIVDNDKERKKMMQIKVKNWLKL